MTVLKVFLVVVGRLLDLGRQIDIAKFSQVKRMAIVAFETSLYQSQIFLADRTGKGSRRSEALEFGFEVCIHSLSVSKEANESNFRMICNRIK